MPLPSATPPAIDDPPPRSSAFAWLFFLAGFTAAIIALGVAWRLGRPPLATVSNRLSLAVWIGAYTLPIAMMFFGAVASWSRPSSPRAVMLVVVVLYTALVVNDIRLFSADLLSGPSPTHAIVLGTYDCRDLSGDAPLTCVELAWHPEGNERPRRERYFLPQQHQPLLQGQCVEVDFWRNIDQLLALRVDTQREDCDALVKRLQTPTFDH